MPFQGGVFKKSLSKTTEHTKNKKQKKKTQKTPIKKTTKIKTQTFKKYSFCNEDSSSNPESKSYSGGSSVNVPGACTSPLTNIIHFDKNMPKFTKVYVCTSYFGELGIFRVLCLLGPLQGFAMYPLEASKGSPITRPFTAPLPLFRNFLIRHRARIRFIKVYKKTFQNILLTILRDAIVKFICKLHHVV